MQGQSELCPLYQLRKNIIKIHQNIESVTNLLKDEG